MASCRARVDEGTQSKRLCASSANLVWTIRVIGEKLIERARVAPDHIVEHERHRGWNRLVAGLCWPLAGILGCRGSDEGREVKAAYEAVSGAAGRTELTMPTSLVPAGSAATARPYFGLHANHVSQPPCRAA
jgi:hypothetical protein